MVQGGEIGVREGNREIWTVEVALAVGNEKVVRG